jgi:hypothetical protein
MPGSKTTQGRTVTRSIVSVRVSFRYANSVGTLIWENAGKRTWPPLSPKGDASYSPLRSIRLEAARGLEHSGVPACVLFNGLYE